MRSYATKPTAADVMERMRQALRLAPSACNIQPWHFIFVTDAELRRKVAQAANGQKWMADAPVPQSCLLIIKPSLTNAASRRRRQT